MYPTTTTTHRRHASTEEVKNNDSQTAAVSGKIQNSSMALRPNNNERIRIIYGVITELMTIIFDYNNTLHSLLCLNNSSSTRRRSRIDVGVEL